MSESLDQLIGDLEQKLRTVVEENQHLRHQLRERRAENRKKLSAEDAELIRDMHRVGWTVTQLAYVFDVNKSTISRIVRGMYYR